IKEISAATPPEKRIGMARFKEVMKEQFLILVRDEERAIEALPKLLPENRQEREAALAALRRVLSSRGALPEEANRRLERIEKIFAPALPARETGDRKRHQVMAGK